MKKADFIECAKLMDTAYENYAEKRAAAENEYLNEMKGIEKAFALSLFDEETLAQERRQQLYYDTNMLAEICIDDDAYLFNSIAINFICKGETEHNVLFY